MSIKWPEIWIQHQFSGGAFSLKAEYPYSWSIEELGFYGCADLDFAAISLRGELMLDVPVGGSKTNIMVFPKISSNPNSFWAALRALHPDVPYLGMPTGDSLNVSTDTAQGYLIAKAKVFEGAAGPELGDPGVRESRVRLFLSSARQTFNVAASSTEEFELTTPIHDSRLHGFPWNDRAPGNTDLELIGIAMDTVTGTHADVSLNGFRMVKSREPLLAQENDLLPASPFVYPTAGLIRPVHVIRDAIPVVPDEEMQVYSTLVNANAGAQDGVVQATLVFLERRRG